MKTLDEVIEQFEKQMEKGQAKILCVGTLDSIPDALHYLEHLKDYYEISANGGLLTPEPLSAEIGSGVEIKWHEPNPPLDWDELRQMEGKPVWLEWTGEPSWGFVDYFTEDFIFFDVPHSYLKFEIKLKGQTWQAYRKERS